MYNIQSCKSKSCKNCVSSVVKRTVYSTLTRRFLEFTVNIKHIISIEVAGDLFDNKIYMYYKYFVYKTSAWLASLAGRQAAKAAFRP